MFFFFSFIYVAFFICLNYSIFKFLESGFKQNKKLFYISVGSLVLLFTFHKLFHLHGMIQNEVLVLLLIFSLSQIILQFMFKLLQYSMDNRIKSSNPKLHESNFYGIFVMIKGIMIVYAFPVLMTLFQIIVILSPEMQKDFYLK